MFRFSILFQAIADVLLCLNQIFYFILFYSPHKSQKPLLLKHVLLIIDFLVLFINFLLTLEVTMPIVLFFVPEGPCFYL